MRDKKVPLPKEWPPMSPADRISRLSPRRREIILPALEDPRRFALLSVRDMAKELGTDPATTVRIARGLGFASYKDFQHYLHELSGVRPTSRDKLQLSSSPDSSLTSMMQPCLNHELKNVRPFYGGMEFTPHE